MQTHLLEAFLADLLHLALKQRALRELVQLDRFFRKKTLSSVLVFRVLLFLQPAQLDRKSAMGTKL